MRPAPPPRVSGEARKRPLRQAKGCGASTPAGHRKSGRARRDRRARSRAAGRTMQKELARTSGVGLREARLELAREHGFRSWSQLKGHVDRLAAEQPFSRDLAYYEGRAEGIARRASLVSGRAAPGSSVALRLDGATVGSWCPTDRSGLAPRRAGQPLPSRAEGTAAGRCSWQPAACSSRCVVTAKGAGQ